MLVVHRYKHSLTDRQITEIIIIVSHKNLHTNFQQSFFINSLEQNIFSIVDLMHSSLLQNITQTKLVIILDLRWTKNQVISRALQYLSPIFAPLVCNVPFIWKCIMKLMLRYTYTHGHNCSMFISAVFTTFQTFCLFKRKKES